MEQNFIWPNAQAGRGQPQIVSGSEPRRTSRTGVAMHRVNAAELDSRRQVQNSPAAMRSGAQQVGTIGPGMTEEGTGILRETAPLANPYVPFQRDNPERYRSQRALARGTLYPGLDLPLRGMVNADKPKTPLTELMALEFAVTELGLYLDTHPDDRDAIAVYRDYAERAKASKKAYEDQYGPLTLYAAGGAQRWDWIQAPWPWDYCREG